MKHFLSVLLCGLLGCIPSQQIIFDPVSTPEVSLIYTNGVASAGTSLDSLTFLLSMDRTELLGSDHFRVWLTCENLSDTPVLVDPEKMFSLVAVPKDTSEVNQEFRMEPRSPELLLKSGDPDVDPNILRKNTLFKNQSVSGYICFRENMRIKSKSGYSITYCDPGEFDYRAIVRLYGDARIVEFKTTKPE